MKNLKISAMAMLMCLGAANAHAAGYQLNEFSTTGLGRSFAGLGVVGDDFSAMAYNPAGMTLVKRSGFQLGVAATEIASTAKTKEGDDKMDFFVPLPSMLGQYNVNDKLFLGAGVYVPYGLATRYKSDSHVAAAEAGVRRSELEVIDTNLSAAYKASNKLSLGASFILRRIKGKLTSNINKDVPGMGMTTLGTSDFRVKGWSTSWHLGAMYEFDENTRLGLSYRFKSTQSPKGKHYIDYYANPITAALGITPGLYKYHSMSDPELPASWILSGYHKFAEKWGTSFTVKYVQWHRFYEFPANSTNPISPDNGVEYRWKDAWTFALGQDYYLNDNWTLRVGTAYDQSPSRDNAYRTNRIPDTNRVWLSAGASYITGNHQFDFGYAHLFMEHGRTRNSNPNSDQYKDAQAKYYSHSNMIALQYQYKF